MNQNLNVVKDRVSTVSGGTVFYCDTVDEFVISHITIANSTGNQPQSVLNLIDKFKTKLERRGTIFLKKMVSGNKLESREFLLNEFQATSLLTLMRNSDKIVDFKMQLVDNFTDLKENIPVLTRLELAKEQVRLIEEIEIKDVEIKRLEINLDESHQWATIKRMESLTKEKFDWRVLKKSSVDLGVDRKDVFDVNYGTVKSYSADMWMQTYAVDLTQFPKGFNN